MTSLGGTGLFIWVGPRGRCPCLRHAHSKEQLWWGQNNHFSRLHTALADLHCWPPLGRSMPCPVHTEQFLWGLGPGCFCREEWSARHHCWVIWQSLWNGSLFILPASGPCWIKGILSWAWWYTLVISALKRLRCGNCESEASLGYMESSRSACLGESREVGDIFGTREMARQ